MGSFNCEQMMSERWMTSFKPLCENETNFKQTSCSCCCPTLPFADGPFFVELLFIDSVCPPAPPTGCMDFGLKTKQMNECERGSAASSSDCCVKVWRKEEEKGF